MRGRSTIAAAAWLVFTTGTALAGTSSSPRGLHGVRLVVPAASAGAPFERPRSLLLPAGWRAELWARVAGARFAAWTPEKGLLVSVPGSGSVVLLTPRRDPAATPKRRVLLSGLADPEGLAFDVLAGHPVLYVAESGRLDRYSWSGLRRTLVGGGLPDPDGLDRLKGLAVAPDHTIYTGVGSESRGGAPRGVILAIRPSGERRIVARGVRYAEGLAVDRAGRVWAAANSALDLPDGVERVGFGRARFTRPLPPHTAPLGLSFPERGALPAPWRDGALLAVHGARALASSARPAVLWLPWKGGMLGAPRTLVGGFQQGRDRWGRPSDALVGPDGALYVVDDTAGAVYRLTPP